MEIDLKPDNTLAAMSAWNVLTEFLDEDKNIFDDVDKFASFYSTIVSKLHEEDREGQ